MILQCDQCNTRFRLDDSKLKPGGVKVRCSKCRHIFLAVAEQKEEESEFDAILSGLGAPAAEKREDAVPARQEPTEFSFEDAMQKAAGFAHEPAAPERERFSGEPTQPGVNEEAAAAGQARNEFHFDEVPVPETVAPRPAPSTADTFDFAAFDFPAEPLLAQDKPEAAEPPDSGLFEFTPEAFQPETRETSPSQKLDFGDFAFEEEPAALKEEAGPAAAGGLEFEDAPFAQAPAAGQTDDAAAASAGGMDFGDFNFDTEPLAIPQDAPPASAALDFGEFSFSEEPVTGIGKEESAPAARDDFDFSDFSFAEEPTPAAPAPAESAADGFGSFSFSDDVAHEEHAAVAPVPVPEDVFSWDESALSPKSPETETPLWGQAVEPAEPTESAEPAGAAVAEEAGSAGMVAAGLVGAAGLAGAAHVAAKAEAEPPQAAPSAPSASDAKKTAEQGSPFDFDFGSKSGATALPEEGFDEEELPPLSISSRRKGRSMLTVAVVTISVLAVLALSGAGLYLLQSGPEALAKFDQLGLGFVGKWFGMENPEEGRITIRNPLAAFYQNKEAGEIFVVTGEAVNSYRKARASITVKVSLFDKNGAVLMQKVAYCGNSLSKEQLATLPVAKIESIMTNQFGDSLTNLGVKPGEAIGFVVAIPNVPKEAADFGVEVVGSTVAGQ